MSSSELQNLRAEIDLVNSQLRALLQRRAQLALAIGRHKRALGMPIADPAREADMLASIASEDEVGFDAASLRAIFSTVFHESRRLLEAADDESG